jgi:arginine N-succinyltransferase
MVPAIERFLVRGGEERDLPDLFRLSRYLDSYNLPADRERLRRLLRDSRASFAGRPPSVSRARYLFVLEDREAGRIAGCSLVIGKHGTPGLPHIFMTSFVEKRRSRTLRRTVLHPCLRLGSTEDGPTEVGGLVLLPAYRGRPEKLGLWLSLVRFLYIAAHPRQFQQSLLAEFMPVFLKRGRSPFWEYFGKKFTGLSYKKADRLSIDNKEFILSLFPAGAIYQDFFPKRIVRFLGQVGDPSVPAARILQKVGFTFLHQIEPFDGGPYYGALTRSVAAVRRARQLQCRTGSAGPAGRPHLLLAETADGRVRALVAPARIAGHQMAVPDTARAALGLQEGGWAWALPFRL